MVRLNDLITKMPKSRCCLFQSCFVFFCKQVFPFLIWYDLPCISGPIISTLPKHFPRRLRPKMSPMAFFAPKRSVIDSKQGLGGAALLAKKLLVKGLFWGWATSCKVVFNGNQKFFNVFQNKKELPTKREIICSHNKISK